jgi:hypothetical protein
MCTEGFAMLKTSCCHCGYVAVLAGHMANDARGGTDYFQCLDCHRVTWREVPNIPRYRLAPLPGPTEPKPSIDGLPVR